MEQTENSKPRRSSRMPNGNDRLKAELRREHDMYLRALADFENYRRPRGSRSRQVRR